VAEQLLAAGRRCGASSRLGNLSSCSSIVFSHRWCWLVLPSSYTNHQPGCTWFIGDTILVNKLLNPAAHLALVTTSLLSW
jgi:hypothetical protein